MYYEERIIGETLMYRTSPDGEFEPVVGVRGIAFHSLMALRPGIRAMLFKYFCTHCGEHQTRCTCVPDGPYGLDGPDGPDEPDDLDSPFGYRV